MISRKSNQDSPALGLQLSRQDAGCCPPGDGLVGVLYRFVFASLPTTFSAVNVTVDGTTTNYPFVHTYSSAAVLRQALYDIFVAPVSQGGLGMFVDKNDLKVYIDTFNSDRLTIELLSGHVIVSIVTNLGTNTGTALANSFVGCLHRFDYTHSDPIEIVIDNIQLTLTTYATTALLISAINTQLTANSLTDRVVAKARDGEVAGHADLWMHVQEGIQVYINGSLSQRGKCERKYIA